MDMIVKWTLMRKYILALLLGTIGHVVAASTMERVELSLRVDKAGYTDVEIFERDNSTQDFSNTQNFTFLSFVDAAPLGFSRTRGFTVGEIISFSAIIPASGGELNDCELGGYSCVGNEIFPAFGYKSSAQVSVRSTGPDFEFISGLNAGDTGSLFEGDFGAMEFLDFPGGNIFATWDFFEHEFTVIAPVTPVPLPASSILLLGGLGMSWVAMGRIARGRKVQKFIA